MLLKSSLCSLFIFSAPLLAQPGTFGAEFTFTNNHLIASGELEIPRSDANAAAQEQWEKAIRQRCESRSVGDSDKCQVSLGNDKLGEKKVAVSYRHDSWQYTVTLDDFVIEVQTSPGTLTDYRRMRTRIQTDIFDLAASLDLLPRDDYGGGHIHLGLHEFFAGQVNLLEDFAVDYQNFPTLNVGGLAMSPNNAHPISIDRKRKREEVNEVLDEFDSLPPRRRNLRSFSKMFTERVYKDSEYTFASFPDFYEKYQAVNLMRGYKNTIDYATTSYRIRNNERTVELRGFKAQRNVDEFILELELIEARISYLKKLRATTGHGIRYNEKLLRFKWAQYKAKASSLSAEEKIHHFCAKQRTVDELYEYVVSAGLVWERYAVLLPQALQGMKPSHSIKKKVAILAESLAQEETHRSAS